jgi:succinylglutamate desuccinylase
VDTSKDAGIPGVVHIGAGEAGPRVVMFCGTHGDEISGIHALEKLFFDLYTGARTLLRGTLTLVRVNQIAIDAERRYVKHNVNRLFREEYGPEIDRNCYEFTRVQQLKPLLQRCDYFLDLHSAPIAQEPFLVAERDAAAFYAKLGLPHIIVGWGRFSAGPIGGDAENYAASHGAIAATLESGSHFEKRSNDVAYRTALALLSRLGMVDGIEESTHAETNLIEMYAVVTKESDDFRYAGEASNFRHFARGDVFAYQGGQPLAVSEDSYLLIPMKPEETKLREEVCYLGRRLREDAPPPFHACPSA